MRTFLRGTLLGTVAAALVVYALALGVAILADASGWSSFEAALGPLPLLEFARTDRETSTTLGTGLLVVALLLGTLNGAAAILMQRRKDVSMRGHRSA
jgi:hypothetical protein